MNTTTYLLLSLFSSYFITRLLIPYVISAAKSRNLLDRPDGRKQHKEAIPALGGIAIFAAFATCLLYTSPSPRDRTRSRMTSSA